MVDSAVEAVATLEKEALEPTHTGQKMMLSAQCVKIEENVNSFDLWLTLTSIGRQIKLHIPLRKHRHLNLFASWKRSTTVVIHRQYVQFSFETKTDPKKETGRCVGIDVGINHLLATSEGALLGDEVKRLIDNIKRKVQGSKGYKRAKKTLSYYLHKVVKQYFKTNPDLRLVVVERLKGLKQGKGKRHKSFRQTLTHWNYRELLDIIQMRCEENRVSFRSVNPYKTSQTCPTCSHIERGSRRNEKFKCLKCGFAGQADIVAALNILRRFTSGRYGAAFQTHDGFYSFPLFE